MPSMGKSEDKSAPQSQNPQFSTWEVMVMERLLHEGKGFVLDENLFRSLSEEFSRVRGRTGAEPQAVQMEDVQRWVLTRRDEVEIEVASSADAGKEFVADSDPSLPKDEPQSSSDASKDTGEKNPELMEFDFEAKSLRDQAWYDVATFLAYRVSSVTDEPEVRVRFQGFGAEEDEWVNVKTAVRARSIPLEAFDCRRVVVGDLVLCFRETNAQALYFDAHVLDIKRRVHDIRGCRCLFSVRYDHDYVEDTVTLRRLCRRPEN